jgi:4-amino-4-deoxy-L-arabinose transferase-like glycosyltransferase
MPRLSKQRRTLLASASILLLGIYIVELATSAWRQSPTFDEGAHIYSGYSYWKHGDFGMNPEHPPLVKLLAAVPLLGMHLWYPPPPTASVNKLSEYDGGEKFLYFNHADVILFRARMAAAMLSVAAACLVFVAADEMFGAVPALLALLLFVFEPNLIAHGSLVTTDMGMALFLFATVYAFYRYVKKPSWSRLVVTGLAGGLALASKHSGVLCLLILPLLALFEVLRKDTDSTSAEGGRGKYALRLAASLVVIGLVSVAVLWSSYGFRFHLRPAGQAMVPPFDRYIASMPWPLGKKAVSIFARYHLLPEPFLYGFADVIISQQYVTGYLLGKIYSGHGSLLYYPAAFAIKSTLGLMLLLLLLPVAMAMRRTKYWREFGFLLIPAAVYFVTAMRSGFNTGVRHILPVYPFLIVLAAFAAWHLARMGTVWRYVVAAIVVLSVISSVRAFPNYLPYSNELWGGPANTYKYLVDSNADWGQQLKATKKYLDERGIKDCWFDYSARTAVDPAYYGIPCKPLPDAIIRTKEAVPVHVDGTVLISATEYVGPIWGPGELNPYAQFHNLRPDAFIADGVFVFHGGFDLPLAAATSHAGIAVKLIQEGKLNEALTEAQNAVAIAPNDVGSQYALGDALMHLERKDEAKAAFQRAITLAETIYPEYQANYVLFLKEQLNK